jgi:hypothetical protein
VYRCVLEDDEARPLEIPQWMFEAVACGRTALSSAPAVTCAALRALSQLLEGAACADEPAKRHAAHLTDTDSSGGADATHESFAVNRAAGLVFSACTDAAVERSAEPGALRDTGVACATAARSSSRRSAGGGRAR